MIGDEAREDLIMAMLMAISGTGVIAALAISTSVSDQTELSAGAALFVAALGCGAVGIGALHVAVNRMSESIGSGGEADP